MRNYYKPGSWNMICDSCGRKFKNDELKKDWRGLWVCDEDYETRHPQTLIQVPTDNPTVPVARPEPNDIFVSVNYINPDDVYSPLRNLLLYTEDFTNAVWTTANVTMTTGVNDPSGGTRAISLTATANSSTGIYQQVTVPSGSVGVNSVYIRRVNGTSAVYLSNVFGGLTNIASSLSSTWARFSSDSRTDNGGLFTFEVLLGNTGDTIEIAFPQTEYGTAATAYQKVPR